MANVRSLLRNELVSRGVVSQSGSVTTRVTKKRKVESNSDELVRKRSRAVLADLPSDSQPSSVPPVEPAAADGDEQEQDTDTAHLSSEEAADLALTPEDERDVEEPISAASTTQTPSEAPQGGLKTVDENEWAAFEREVVAPTRFTRAPPAAMAAATISAAPVSAQEIIAQQRKEREELARAREADVEGEKEDAARLLEEEFDEMEQLEERVRRLKEKREELRRRRMEDGQSLDVTVESGPADNNLEGDNRDSDESGSDEDSGGWEDWRFR